MLPVMVTFGSVSQDFFSGEIERHPVLRAVTVDTHFESGLYSCDCSYLPLCDFYIQ